MNTNIENWISDALTLLGLYGRKATAPVASNIHSHARSAFVKGAPRSWWLSLKTEPTRWSSHEKALHELVVDMDAQGWFIPETETADSLVYRLSAREAELVVGECPFFEYYFLDDQCSLLVIENDHNEFFVCRYDVEPPISDSPPSPPSESII